MIKDKVKIAVIMTFHNRKNKTLNCVEQIISQNNIDNVELSIYACDDGSTDGTSEAIIQKDSTIQIVKGDGNLFWARGMAKAMEEAAKKDFDFFLMVNDDVDFFSNMLEVMLTAFYDSSSHGKVCAIVGCTCDKGDNHTYGGIKWIRKGFKLKSKIVFPTDGDLECTITNWNCFLLPQEIYKKVGKIDTKYEHGLADFDYSLRIGYEGYTILSTKEYIGRCERNPIENTWQDKTLPVIKRWKLMQKRTAKPWRSDVHFYSKHFGVFWPYWFLRQYIGMLKK